MRRPLATLLLLLSVPALAQSGGSVKAPRGDETRAEPLFVRALAALYRGEVEQAVSTLGEVLALVPDDPVVLDALAEAYQAQGRWADALYHAEAAVAVAPDEALIQRRLAALYDAVGDTEQAEAARSAADRIAPESPTSLGPPTPNPPARREAPVAPAGDTPGVELPGAAAHAAGRYAEAADALFAVVEADPRRLDAWPLALDALARSGDARAADAAALAVLLYPALPSVLVPAGEAFASAGQSGDARDAATAALQALDVADDAPDLRARAQSLLSSLD